MESIKLAKLIQYRDHAVPVFIDNETQNFYCIIDNIEYNLGLYNASYEDEIHSIIDDKLDIIYVFPEPYNAAKLCWFNNGGARDIKLIYNNRILKIFLVSNNYVISENEKVNLIKLSESILQRVVLKKQISEIKEISYL